MQSTSHEWHVSKYHMKIVKRVDPSSLHNLAVPANNGYGCNVTEAIVWWCVFDAFAWIAIIGSVYIPSLHGLSVLFLHSRNIEIILREHPVLQRGQDMPLSNYYWSNELVHFFYRDCVFNFYSTRDLFSFLYVFYVWCVQEIKIYFFVYAFMSLRW